jgi:hypothetical protein
VWIDTGKSQWSGGRPANWCSCKKWPISLNCQEEFAELDIWTQVQNWC